MRRMRCVRVVWVTIFFGLAALIAPPVACAAEEVTRGNSPAGGARDANLCTLYIAPCSAPVAVGKAMLRVTSMKRRPGGFSGEYQIKVIPLGFANESGQLSVIVDDSTLRKLMGGAAVGFTGRAVTTGTGKTRPLTGTATPLDNEQGTIQMWFLADARKVVFNTTYRFGQN